MSLWSFLSITMASVDMDGSPLCGAEMVQDGAGRKRSQTRWAPRAVCSSAKTDGGSSPVRTPGASAIPAASSAVTPHPRPRSPSRGGSTPAAAGPPAGRAERTSSAPAFASRTTSASAPGAGLPASRTASYSTERVAAKVRCTAVPSDSVPPYGATTSGTMPARRDGRPEVVRARRGRRRGRRRCRSRGHRSARCRRAETGPGSGRAPAGARWRPVPGARARRPPGRTGRGRCWPAPAADAP